MGGPDAAERVEQRDRGQPLQQDQRNRLFLLSALPYPLLGEPVRLQCRCLQVSVRERQLLLSQHAAVDTDRIFKLGGSSTNFEMHHRI